MKDQCQIDTKVLVFYMSKLLKNDWENVKKTNSFIGNTPLLNTLFLITTTWYVFNNIKDISIPSPLTHEADWQVISTLGKYIAYFITVKLLVALTLNSSEIRRYVSNDVFGLYNHRLPFNTTDLLSTLVMLLIKPLSVSIIPSDYMRVRLVLIVLLIAGMIFWIIMNIQYNSSEILETTKYQYGWKELKKPLSKAKK